MARRILNRKDLRADYDAAERRKEEDPKGEEEETEDEDEDEDEASDEAEESDEEDEGDEDEEEAKPKKKPKKVVKEVKPKRVRAAKVVRQRVVWGVFDNSNRRVATFDYPKKQEAQDHAAKLKSESKTNQTYFIQPVKEAME
jgi:hypothetical protein